jgi:hypothetical protein
MDSIMKYCSVVLCALPSMGQTSVRRIFHQKIQPHMLSKLNIKKIVWDLRRQLVVRGIKLKTLTHAIIRDLIRRLSYDGQIPGRPSGYLSAKRQGLLRHQNYNVGLGVTRRTRDLCHFTTKLRNFRKA